MKAVQLLVNSYLPEDLRNYSQSYDKKSMNKILRAVADKYPDKFAGIQQKISDIGRMASYYQGETISLKDLASPIDKASILKAMDQEVAALPKDKHHLERKLEIFQKYNNLIEAETSKAALKQRNSIAMSALSGARGNAAQMKAMISTPGTYSDYKGRTVPVFSRESFAEGIRPATYLASTNGSRASVVSTKCLDGNTMVRMADLSEKRLADIAVGEKVLGADKEGRVFPVEVVNVFDQGDKDCYRYKFDYSSCRDSSMSSEVVCTEDHKFLMISSSEYNRKRSLHSRGKGPRPTWEDRHVKRILPAGRMHRGANVSVCNPLYPQGGLQGSKNEPWALLLGLLIGDGCLTVTSRTSFSCADSTLISDITPELEKLGHKIVKRGSGPDWVIVKRDYSPLDNNTIVKGKQGFVAGGKSYRYSMLEEYGLLGKYSWEKRLPKGWYDWDRQSVANLLAGLFAADGSIFKTKNSSGRVQVNIDLGTTSKELARDVQLALSVVFGITARIEKPAYKGGFSSSGEERIRPLYTLSVSRAEDVLLFYREIGSYIPGVKRDRLASLCKEIVIKQHNPYAKHSFKGKEHVGLVHCYDIEVDHDDHLFVLANGLITSNSSTARGGDWSKQAAAACTDLVIREDDCGTSNGILLAPDDKSLRGRVLAKSVAGVQAGTFITRDVLDKIQKSKVKGVMVRSAMTCGCGNGLCAKCIGKFYNGGKLPKIGDAIGLLASSTLGEPVVQGALNAKHTAGMTKNKRSYAGLDFISQFSQSPEVFKDRAAVTEEDGRVDRIEEAPQGGKYIFVNGKRYYTPIGLDPIVKAGDKVEAGDQLADGLVDPEDVVRLKGLGEGRRYYAERFGQILADSGAGTDRRNTEVLARGALRHVKVTNQDGIGCYLPDDTIDYNSFQRSYRVPETAREMSAKDAVGKYLQAPVMHYTIGTRITPKMAAALVENDYGKVLADDTEPGFQPVMVRLRTASHSNPDWMASLGTSYLTKQLNESATRGDDTNVLSNDDFRPRLAYGAGFGEHVRETGKF